MCPKESSTENEGQLAAHDFAGWRTGLFDSSMPPALGKQARRRAAKESFPLSSNLIRKNFHLRWAEKVDGGSFAEAKLRS